MWTAWKQFNWSFQSFLSWFQLLQCEDLSCRFVESVLDCWSKKKTHRERSFSLFSEIFSKDNQRQTQLMVSCQPGPSGTMMRPQSLRWTGQQSIGKHWVCSSQIPYVCLDRSWCRCHGSDLCARMLCQQIGCALRRGWCWVMGLTDLAWSYVILCFNS